MAGVDKQEHPAQIGPAGKIGLHKAGPGIDLSLGRLGVAIARQVDEIARL
jgi:hypothetical protein